MKTKKNKKIRFLFAYVSEHLTNFSSISENVSLWEEGIVMYIPNMENLVQAPLHLSSKKVDYFFFLIF